MILLLFFVARLLLALIGVLFGAGTLLLSLFLLLVVWLGATPSGLKMLINMAESTGMVQVGQVEGRLLDHFRLQQIKVQVGDAQVALDCLEMRWQPWELWQQRVQIDALRVAGIAITPGEAESESSAPWKGLVMPIAVHVDELAVRDVRVLVADGQAQPVFRELSARFMLDQRGLDVHVLEVDDLAAMAGSALRLRGNWALQPTASLHFAFDWRVQHEQTTLVGEGELLGRLHALHLRHQLTAPLPLALEANVDALDGELPWNAALTMPPVALAEHAHLLSALPPELRANLGKAALELRAQGTRRHALIEQVQVTLAGGSARLAGEVCWGEGLRWDVAMQAENLRPELLAADWPGRLALRLDSAGTLQDGRPLGSVHLSHLAGELRGYALQGGLSADILAWGEHLPHLKLDELQLRSGQSRVQAHGVLNQRLDMQLAIDSPNLAEFLPQASGTLRAQATLQGEAQQPQVRLEARGQALGWQDSVLDTLELKGEGSLRQDALINLDLTARGLRRAGQSVLETAKLDIRGSAPAHELRLALVQAPDKLRVNLRAQGGWNGHEERLKLQSLVLDHTPAGSWASKEPAELLASAQQVALSRFCGLMTSPPGKANVCLQGQWRAGIEGAQARLELSDFDLKGLDALLQGRPLQLRGVLGGSVEMNAPQGKPMTLKALLDGQEVLARVQTGAPNLALQGVPEWREIPLDRFEAGAELGGGVGRVSANIGINDANRFEAQIRLPGLSLDGGVPAKQPLQGYVDLRFEDNALLAGFLPMLKEPQGRLAGRLLLDGTLDAPKISGGVQVVDGRVILPDLGVRVSEGRMLLRADATNVLKLDGSALLGSGRARLSGTIDLRDMPHWRADMQVSGENLTVMRLPQASVQASPDLQLALAPGKQQVRGAVTVPQALFDIGGFGAGALRRSADVRILGEAPPEPQSLMDVDVDLVLGEQVRIEGMGFKGRVTGQIRVLDNPSYPQPVAQGELQVVDGRYRAYGQDLLIDQGRVMFANSPLSNPGLDIRAVRRVTQDDVVVGLHITGRATSPRINLFSQPAMQQSEMLSYLVSGRSSRSGGGASTQAMLQIAQAAGLMAASDLAEGSIAKQVGLDEMGVETALGSNELSLVLGKYLTPRLHLRYLQGLSTGVQDLVMTFDWTRAIQVRGQYGTRASSVDVFYRFER